MVDILDAQFPKGKSKERGQALVMIAYIEMMLRGIKFDKNIFEHDGYIYIGGKSKIYPYKNLKPK